MLGTKMRSATGWKWVQLWPIELLAIPQGTGPFYSKQVGITCANVAIDSTWGLAAMLMRRPETL